MEYFKIFLSSLLSTIPQIAIVIICIWYYRSSKSKNSIYLLLGAIFSLIKIAFTPFTFYLLLIDLNLDAIQAGVIGGTLNLIGLIGTFFFAFAFRSLIKKLLTLSFTSKKDVINEIGQS